MVRFYGTACGKMDDKGRIVLPAAFRDAMVRGGSGNMTLVVKMNVQECCIDLFPADEWERRSEKILDRIDPELNAGDARFWTKYNDGVSTLVPDEKLGRLSIPSALLERAGITKEVVFGGVGYKLQLWNPDTRKASLLTDEEFKANAKRLSERQ